MTACIVGARTIDQLESNLVAWEADVPQEALDEATAIGDELWDTAPWKPQMQINLGPSPFPGLSNPQSIPSPA